MSDDSFDIDTQVALDLAKSIHPMLAGQPDTVIAATLADLVSLLIAGHVVDGNPVETRKLRDRLLTEHVNAVKKLIPLQEAMLKERASEPQERPN